MSELISHTIGTGDEGNAFICVPEIVLFEVEALLVDGVFFLLVDVKLMFVDAEAWLLVDK